MYAPGIHRDQMSGIVAGSICLGKPLLVAAGRELPAAA
jgi:hypothetical protein